MKFSTFFTTAILLLSAAADAFPQPRNPAATAPRRTTKATSRTSKTRAKPAGVSKTKATTAGKRKTTAGTAGKRACGPHPKEKLTNCSLCPGLKKRGKDQRSKNKNVLVLSAPAKDNVDDLVDDVDCWQCTNASKFFPPPSLPPSRPRLSSGHNLLTSSPPPPPSPNSCGQLVKFTGPQVKRAAVDALKRNLSGSLITYDRGDLGAKEWPHYYGNAEGALPAAGGDLSKYITFPLLAAGSYTGGNPGAFRVTIGLSANEIPQTVNVMKHPNGDSTTYVKVEKGKK
ncbi:uncharacterized protein LAJ45_03699 [Morchella importuna]|uniref:uncharacterized protein n=1 Tax=Morchella importuna TaxID=1174673 RepID=UPI001E8DE921|nr:uncharacterized protein LAJ45_03699 [Morchella importuna]KAH8152273.1 hypothetical protein LAJ45_03699 [Morchella importuna]